MTESKGKTVEPRVEFKGSSYCYKDVVLTHENMMNMVQDGVPMIEVDGILYLPIAFVGGKKGVAH